MTLSDSRKAYIDGWMESLQKRMGEYTPVERLHAEAALAWHRAQLASYTVKELDKVAAPDELIQTAVTLWINAGQLAQQASERAIDAESDEKKVSRIRTYLAKAPDMPQPDHRHPVEAIRNDGHLRGLHIEAVRGSYENRERQRMERELQDRINAGQHDGYGTSYPDVEYLTSGINQNNPPWLVKNYADDPEGYTAMMQRLNDYRDSRPGRTCLVYYKDVNAREAYLKNRAAAAARESEAWHREFDQ